MIVNEKNRSITVIAFILIIAIACGYLFISGPYFQGFLKNNGLFQPGPSPKEVLPATPVTETGNTDIITGSGKVPFESAIGELYLSDSEGLINLENTTFHEITGFGVDLDGSADNWLIGARKNGDNILFSFDSGRWNEMIWPGHLSEGVLKLDNNTSPGMLYIKNSDIIAEYYQKANVSSSDFSMDSESCTIIIDNGDQVAVLKFKTGTGEMI